ncbi:MAG TPA: protease modulator HflC [Polyangiales bacterium]|jgi:membrane protease subunit HflC|nr:protease modulator HflC [Polyangiales bacterium]
MSARGFVMLVVAVAAVVVLQSGMYTVAENEQVLLTEFGKIVGAKVSTPGLHWKAPFVQEVHSLDKRWLEWDGAANQIPTRDKKYIWIEAFARWRISEPIRFYKTMHDEQSAQSRLDDIIDGEIRNVIANHDLIDIVRSSARAFEHGDEVDDGQTDETVFKPTLGREQISALVLQKSSQVMPEYGVELEDVKIKRINYVDSVQQKVFERMISERKRIAERYRSEGQGKRAEIEGKVERELLRIRSEAYKTAEETRGKADAEAARIYAEAYNRDPELYAFLKTLETYKTVMADNTDIVLSTDAPLLKYLRSEKP